MKKTEKLFKIRVKDCPEVKNHPDLRKFTGWARIAKLTTTGLFLFTFVYHDSVRIIEEPYTIASHLVDIIS